MKIQTQNHPFHLVDPSPWPLITSLAALGTTTGGVMYFHGYNNGQFFLLFTSLFFLIFMMFIWWRDVVRESTFEGNHTKSVEYGLRMGMVLFIVSEVMFFSLFLSIFSFKFITSNWNWWSMTTFRYWNI